MKSGGELGRRKGTHADEPRAASPSRKKVRFGSSAVEADPASSWAASASACAYLDSHPPPVSPSPVSSASTDSQPSMMTTLTMASERQEQQGDASAHSRQSPAAHRAHVTFAPFPLRGLQASSSALRIGRGIQLANCSANGFGPQASHSHGIDDTRPGDDLANLKVRGASESIGNCANPSQPCSNRQGDTEAGVAGRDAGATMAAETRDGGEGSSSKGTAQAVDELISIMPRMTLERSRSELETLMKRKQLLGSFSGTPKSADGAVPLNRTRSF